MASRSSLGPAPSTGSPADKGNLDQAKLSPILLNTLSVLFFTSFKSIASISAPTEISSLQLKAIKNHHTLNEREPCMFRLLRYSHPLLLSLLTEYCRQPEILLHK